MSELQKSKSGNWVIPNSFQTPNFLVDELMFYLTPEEICCLIYAVRCILGYQDKIVERKARIAISSFRRVGLGQTATRNALHGLNQYKILMVEGEPTQSGQMLKFQEDQDQIDWDGLKRRRREKDEKQSARTAHASLLNPNHKPVSSDEPLSSNDMAGVSCDDRGVVSCDDNIKTQLKIQNPTRGDAKTVADTQRERTEQAYLRSLQKGGELLSLGIDLSGFPADVAEVVCETCKEWKLRTPIRKSDKKKWIEDARELRQACGELGLEPMRKERARVVAYMQEHGGTVPYTYKDIGSLVGSVRSMAAQMRSAQDATPVDPLAALRAAGFIINGARA